MSRALIVEDNATFRQMLKEILLDRFPEMQIAEDQDGSEIIEEIEMFRPDIVFMDIRLPAENGLDLARKVKTRHPEIKVVILTSYDLPEYREAARQSKADDFVTKDSPTQDFLRLVEFMLSPVSQPKAQS